MPDWCQGSSIERVNSKYWSKVVDVINYGELYSELGTECGTIFLSKRSLSRRQTTSQGLPMGGRRKKMRYSQRENKGREKRKRGKERKRWKREMEKMEEGREGKREEGRSC